MEINSPKFFIEINRFEYIFGVGDHDEDKDFQLIYKKSIPLQAISNNRIIDFDLANISNSGFQNAIAIRESSNLSWIQSIMTNTIRAWKPADQMSVYFVSKHRKTTEINSLLKHTSNLRLHNVDLRNLMLIMSVFSS